MAIHYRLLQNQIKGSKNYRKYYALSETGCHHVGRHRVDD